MTLARTRCVHAISINKDMLKKILSVGMVSMTNAQTKITFKNDMSPADKKELAAYLITTAAKEAKS